MLQARQPSLPVVTIPQPQDPINHTQNLPGSFPSSNKNDSNGYGYSNDYYETRTSVNSVGGSYNFGNDTESWSGWLGNVTSSAKKYVDQIKTKATGMVFGTANSQDEFLPTFTKKSDSAGYHIAYTIGSNYNSSYNNYQQQHTKSQQQQQHQQQQQAPLSPPPRQQPPNVYNSQSAPAQPEQQPQQVNSEFLPKKPRFSLGNAPVNYSVV